MAGGCARRPAQRGTPAGLNTLIASADRDDRRGRSMLRRAGEPCGRCGEELPGIGLKLMAGVYRLPNGNTATSNGAGHGQFGKAPHHIEVTRDKRVVWTFADHETMKTISSVEVLDVAGDAIGLRIELP